MMHYFSQKQVKQDLCYASSGYILNRNICSTGYVVDNAFIHNDCTDEIAENYLLNSSIDETNPELIYSINKYLNYPLLDMSALSGATQYPGFEKIKLTKKCHLDMSLENAIARRKTCRQFSGDVIGLDYLHAILHNSAGITHTYEHDEYARNQRCCPSGGGLYPVKLYILSLRIRQLSQKIYFYDPLMNSLVDMNQQEKIINHFVSSQQKQQSPNIADCAFILFFTIEHWRSVAKYQSAGLRFALLELGAIAEHAHLAATCLGLGSCPYASFKVDEINHLLNIDGKYENFQHAILFGPSSEKK